MSMNRHAIETVPPGTRVRVVGDCYQGLYTGAVYERIDTATGELIWRVISRSSRFVPPIVRGSFTFFQWRVERVS